MLRIVVVSLLACSLAPAESVPNRLTTDEKLEGWQLLFDGSTSTGWEGFQNTPFPETSWAIEDGTIRSSEPLLDFDLAVARIAAGRAAADETGVPAVLNARCDVFLRGGTGPEALAEAIRRCNAFREAGADCLFVPFARDAETIGALVEGIDGPLNILANAVSPPVPELKRLGVARISIGGLLSLAYATLARKAAGELDDSGTYGFAEGVILHPGMNALMAGD